MRTVTDDKQRLISEFARGVHPGVRATLDRTPEQGTSYFPAQKSAR
jgi:hypothetical protein